MPKSRFPESFDKKLHIVIPEATQWTLANDKDEVIISVVGGGMGLNGDGITSFEMWDNREDDPQMYLTVDEINAHITKNPIK